LKNSDFLALSAQCNAFTAPKQLAMSVVATGVIIDPIAITDVEAVLGAIAPDRALHKPRKYRREGRIKLASINVGRDQAENPSAPARPVAPISVRVVGAQPLQDPGSVQEIMDLVSTATKVAPTSTHRGRRLPAANSKVDNAIANTLSETP
jgi:hypothetical protein